MTDTPEPPGPDATITLRELSQETVVPIIDLKVADNQTHFVAPNAVSIAQAYFEQPRAWFRGVYADETPVGFVMISDEPDQARYFLWRFMIGEAYQGRGYGKGAIQRLVEYVKSRPNATELLVSYVPGEGSPEGFYIKQGFIPTGEKDEDELIARMPLTEEAKAWTPSPQTEEAEPTPEEEPAPPPAPGPDATVTLREVTRDNLRAIFRLKVRDDQTRFVANNAISIAQAFYEPKAWFRAIYADETPVGFLMLYDDPDEPKYYLWRFLIGADHQGKGFGRKAIKQLVEYVKTRPNAAELELAYVPGEGSPEWFYRKLGFQPTGEERHGELIARLPLDGGAA